MELSLADLVSDLLLCTIQPLSGDRTQEIILFGSEVSHALIGTDNIIVLAGRASGFYPFVMDEVT